MLMITPWYIRVILFFIPVRYRYNLGKTHYMDVKSWRGTVYLTAVRRRW